MSIHHFPTFSFIATTFGCAIASTALLEGASWAQAGGSMAQAVEEAADSRVANLDGVWSFTVGFGEIPFLAGSFKPSVSIGYHFNRFIYVGGIFQLSDLLERGDQSWNAVNAGVDGLVGTRETTGPRAFVGARLRPHRYSPYLSLGAVFNGTDIETMSFDGRSRTIAGETYEGPLSVELARPFGIRPAFGLGYGYTFEEGLVLNLEFSGAWLFKPADPDARVEGGAGLSEGARQALVQQFVGAYEDNWHNRYHLFNISVGYAF